MLSGGRVGGRGGKEMFFDCFLCFCCLGGMGKEFIGICKAWEFFFDLTRKMSISQTYLYFGTNWNKME